MIRKIETIIKNNDLDYVDNPMVIVFRNTDVLTGDYIGDTGENAMDGFVFYSDMSVKTMQGRTMPNKSYLDKFFADGKLDAKEKFNYVAPCYLKYAFKKGLHKNKYKALRQNRKFPVIRSFNEIFGDNDDYFMYDWPCDNVHGYLKSLGCWAVAGNMNPPTGDWADAHRWIYEIHRDTNNFDALCLTREDWENPFKQQLRFGSKGRRVKKLQEQLGIKLDGDFGFNTLKAVIDKQKKNDEEITGIVE